MGHTVVLESLETRTLRSASVAPPALTDPGHNLHVSAGQVVNIDPTSPLDSDYVAPKSVAWDLNYDGRQFDVDLTGAQPRVAFEHSGTFIVAGKYDFGGGVTELRTFAVTVSDYATEAADPMMHVAAPSTATVGETITLTLSTDHAGETVQYMLDDAGFSGPNGPVELERTFSTGGTYELKIKLYVDGEYVGHASHTVTVAVAETTEPPTMIETTPFSFDYAAPVPFEWPQELSDADEDLLA